MNSALLDILACPVCHGKLLYDDKLQELICRRDRLAYPIKNDIPIMLSSQARYISLEEYEKLSNA